jgi:hypothetical protein
MNLPSITVALCSLAILLPGCGSPPPLVIRHDRTTETQAGQADSYGLHVTNASGTPVHGVTFHCNQSGQVTSALAIDTIQPHATVHLDVFRLNRLADELGIKANVGRTVTATCKGHERPIPASWGTNQ